MFHWDEQAEDANAMSGILQLRTITRTSTMDKAGDFCDRTWEGDSYQRKSNICYALWPDQEIGDARMKWDSTTTQVGIPLLRRAQDILLVRLEKCSHTP